MKITTYRNWIYHSFNTYERAYWNGANHSSGLIYDENGYQGISFRLTYS